MLKYRRWLPAIVMMAIIFVASSTPATQLPNYGFWDMLIKKGGHMTGYGLLSIAWWYGFSFDSKKGWLAWLMAIIYAFSDEFHQSFTPGRHPSATDILFFDGGGALIGLIALATWFRIGIGLQQKKNKGIS